MNEKAMENFRKSLAHSKAIVEKRFDESLQKSSKMINANSIKRLIEWSENPDDFTITDDGVLWSKKEIDRMSEAGKRGAAAGRKFGEAYRMGVTINLSIPHNPSKVKRFFRWILAKIRGDVPVKWTQSDGKVCNGWAKCSEIEKVRDVEPLHVEPVKRECKNCDEATQCGAGTSYYWWCDAGHWHGKPLENVKTFAADSNCHDFKLWGGDER